MLILSHSSYTIGSQGVLSWCVLPPECAHIYQGRLTDNVWKGQKRLYSDPTMFNSFVLLSPDTVVLPIIPTNALEVCQFSTELNHAVRSESTRMPPGIPDVPLLKTSCVLELPSLNPGALVLRMTCRCEPNPRGPPSTATYADKGTPFYSDPDKAVMILHMHLRLPTGITRVYTMIAHRASLLKVVREALERRQNAQTSSAAPGEASTADGIHSDEDEDTPAGAGGTEEPQDLPFAHARPARPRRLAHWLGARSDDEESESEAADAPPPVRIPWAEWGPTVTRWFQDELAGTRWITTTCGQRFVRVRANGRIRVYDFNELAVRRYTHERSLSGSPVGALPGEDILEDRYTEWSTNMEMDDREVEADWEDVEEEGAEGAEVDGGAGADGVEQQTGGSRVQADGDTEEAGPQRLSTDRRLKVVLGSTMIADASAWDGPLESSLPYMETSVSVPDEYESALLDEDIIIGLKVRLIVFWLSFYRLKCITIDGSGG